MGPLYLIAIGALGTLRVLGCPLILLAPRLPRLPVNRLADGAVGMLGGAIVAAVSGRLKACLGALNLAPFGPLHTYQALQKESHR